MNTSAARPDPARVDRRVRRGVLLMAAIAVVVLLLVVREMFRGTLGPFGATAGSAGGLVVGVVASRVQRIDRDVRTGLVVGHIDRIGVAVLVALLVATAAQDWLLGHWATGATLTALGLSATAGTFAGRALGTRNRVREVLQVDGENS
jgi:hypothetical protein